MKQRIEREGTSRLCATRQRRFYISSGEATPTEVPSESKNRQDIAPTLFAVILSTIKSSHQFL
jgi:hypothetical protein